MLYLVTGTMVHFEDGTLVDTNLISKIVFICSSFLPFMVKNMRLEHANVLLLFSDHIPVHFLAMRGGVIR